MILAFAAALVARQAQLDSIVNYKFTGDVPTLLTGLAKKTGVALEAGSSQRDTILVTYLKSVPLSEVMERIAWASYGKWERTKDGYRLVADNDIRRKLRQQYVARATKITADGIAAYRKEKLGEELSESSIKSTVAAWQKYQREHSYPMPPGTTSLVAERALARALGAVNPADVAATEAPASIAYSENPTRCQLPLGRIGVEMLRKYNEEIGIWERGFTDPEGRAPEENAKTAVLKLSYNYSGFATLSLYGEDGKQVGRASVPFPDSNAERRQVPKAVLDAVPKDTEVKLSHESRFFAFKADAQNNFPPQTIPADIIERFRNPERNDPLSTLTADIWTTLGDKMNRSIVANPPDGFLSPRYPMEENRLLAYLDWELSGQTEIDSHWIVRRPHPEPAYLLTRLNRAALGRICRMERGKVFDALEASANLAWASGLGRWDLEMGPYLSWARPANDAFWENVGFLRTFGSLPSDVRHRWFNGESFPISGLSKGTREAILWWAMTTNVPQTYAFEPTVRFPNGLPDRGFLRADILATPGFYTRVHFDDGSVTVRWTSAHDLAADLNGIERGDIKWMGDFELQEIPRREYRLLADFGDGKPIDGLRIPSPDPEPTQYVRWSQAPAEMKARLAEMQKKVKKEYEGG